MKNECWSSLSLKDMDYGFICISHIITLAIINIVFYNSFYNFSSFATYTY